MDFIFGFLIAWGFIVEPKLNKLQTEEGIEKMIKKARRRRKIKEAIRSINMPLVILVILIVSSLFYILKG